MVHLDADGVLQEVRTHLVGQLNDPDIGAVYCDFQRRLVRDQDLSLSEMFARLVEKHGLALIDRKFLPVPPDVARAVLARLFRSALAGPDLTTKSEAERLTRSTIGVFGDDVAFYSQFTFGGASGRSPFLQVGTPILYAPLETSIFMISTAMIGFILVGDD